MALTPADVRNKQFHVVRLRPGYNEEDVDDLLDRVEATLMALQGGPQSGPLITAEEVQAARFRSTRLSPGYNEDEVDDFLDVIVDDLRARGLSSGATAGAARRPTQHPYAQQHPQGPQPPSPYGAPGAAQAPGSGPAQPPMRPAQPPIGASQPPPGAAGPAYGETPRERPRMTPEDVRNKEFATTRLTTGYNEQEVDDFLDSAEVTLEALLNGRPDRALLTPAQVERVQFGTTRARPGYDPAQVDAFLDLLADELRRYEQP
ncbi:DivIVA domain-containing protein [Nocardiopsis gilva YIM 90087]|uniref:Cell wall synthesis protein Wag31 n=1 Tax=Nocardiopsis gilva YIM 90087 TaxID=1235441 RepID=A0A223S1V0_9ACTN|nr:DivIVA domain-containing protein [Nocardiopsis gilva YIM 90087]